VQTSPTIFGLVICAVVGFIVVFVFISWIERLREAKKRSDKPKAGEPPPEAKTWFNVLELSETASLEQIKAAYHKKISQYHPDRVAGLGPELAVLAEARTKEINWAYEAAKRRR